MINKIVIFTNSNQIWLDLNPWNYLFIFYLSLYPYSFSSYIRSKINQGSKVENFLFTVNIVAPVFLMVALDVEHPPAAGTALAVVINEVSMNVFVTIMISALVLSQCRYYLRNQLKDLI